MTRTYCIAQGTILNNLIVICEGNEYEKEHMYMHVLLNHFAVHLKLTQCYKLTLIKKKSKRERKKFLGKT